MDPTFIKHNKTYSKEVLLSSFHPTGTTDLVNHEKPDVITSSNDIDTQTPLYDIDPPAIPVVGSVSRIENPIIEEEENKESIWQRAMRFSSWSIIPVLSLFFTLSAYLKMTGKEESVIDNNGGTKPVSSSKVNKPHLK